MKSKNAKPGKNGPIRGPSIPNQSGKRQRPGLTVTDKK